MFNDIEYSDTKDTSTDRVKSLINDTALAVNAIKTTLCRKNISSHKCSMCTSKNRSHKMHFCTDVCSIKDFKKGSAWHNYLMDKMMIYCTKSKSDVVA